MSRSLACQPCNQISQNRYTTTQSTWTLLVTNLVPGQGLQYHIPRTYIFNIEQLVFSVDIEFCDDPVQWLKENSNNRYAITIGPKTWKSQLTEWSNPRPKAALISLVRNSELEGMQQSMRQLEARWNHKYLYPWIFFNDEPFSEEFMAGTRNLTGAECFYEVVPEEFWSLPDWVDEGRFMNSLDYLGTIGVGKGWMVHFFCNINYDIFRFMRDNQLKYGFNMNILDDARSFPSLWSKTRAFATAHPELLHPEADLNWLLDGGEYNNCQFFSNFEIGSLRFWRGDDDRHVEKEKRKKEHMKNTSTISIIQVDFITRDGAMHPFIRLVWRCFSKERSLVF
ncbi:7007a26f-b1fe-4360-b387-57d3c9b304d3 [Sclerotinia trifoliorum]|uniref:7007a26f-b1fe-4360-b387-57d3c9b304d3 n=1 Tax=Sclerotinia trifoliorum TaxID=28548 RepID=A0A8H2ZTV3_9HELO|nr:7007a26f-b1fe-4360-b387-57d3c9b304d3 [Sclerotinia trifoliorum]